MFFATLAISLNSSGHLGHGIASGERRISIELRERDVAVSYSLGLAAGKTQADLEAAHARGEDNSRLDELTRELTEHVKVCFGRTQEHCRPLSKKELSSVAASGWKTDTLTLDWRFQLPLTDDVFRLEDGWNREEIARTDVSIRPDPARPPLKAGPDEPQKVELEFAFDDRLLAGAPRVVSIELPARKRSGVLPMVGAIVVALLGGGLYLLWRKRSPHQKR